MIKINSKLWFSWTLLILFCWVNTGLAESSKALHFVVTSHFPKPHQSIKIDQGLTQKKPRIEFILHLGNLRDTSEPCSDNEFLEAKELFIKSKIPVILLPAYHDWVECEALSNSLMSSVERLNQWRLWFNEAPKSLGTKSIALASQGQTSRFRAYSENIRWQQQNIVFVTLNLPAKGNNFIKAAGQNGEFEERQVANRWWLEQGFKHAQQSRALVIAFEANPEFNKMEGNYRQDPYLGFKEALFKFSKTYKKPIFIIHNQGQKTLIKRPWPNRPMLYELSINAQTHPKLRMILSETNPVTLSFWQGQQKNKHPARGKFD